MPRKRQENEVRTSWFLDRALYNQLRILAIKQNLTLEELYVHICTGYIETATKEGLL